MNDDFQKIWAFLLYLFDHNIPYMVIGLVGVVLVFAWLTVSFWGYWAEEDSENAEGEPKNE